MFPKIMCSLLMIPGGISSTPLVISHRYVCMMRRLEMYEIQYEERCTFIFQMYGAEWEDGVRERILRPCIPAGLARMLSLSESARP